jgi:predicted regulator of Ras-like GTPase activity (Roadblock/LC7/MglB family)
MVFSEVLKDVADRLEGGVGIVVMGMDGIPIEKIALDEGFNFEMLSTECTSILRTTRQASEDGGAGELRELVIMTQSLTILVATITPDYVLLAAVRPETPYGRARFYLKRAAAQLEKEFV